MVADASSDNYRQTAGRGAVCGAFAGALAGIFDAVLAWGGLGQFLPGFAGKLEAILYVAALYALSGALAVAAGAVAMRALFRHTYAGDLARAIGQAHRDARERGAAHAFAALAVTLVGIPLCALSVAGGYALAYRVLAARRHIGLVIAAAMVIAILAIGFAALATILFARPVTALLARAGRHPRLGAVLSSLHAPVAAAIVLVFAAAGVLAALTWDTVSLLSLRPAVTAAGFLVLLFPAARLARLTLARIARKWPPTGPVFWPRRAIAAGAVLAGIAVILGLGNADAVRKAASRHTGLAATLTATARGAVDLDRDGFSPILGGGDCNDLDASVHPGGIELPGDGVDQNCVGGDPSLERSVDEVGFVPVPATVPDDLNVVLITIDTLRADHLGTYGYDRPTSPRIDAIAKTGTVFENSWAHAPSTRYSIPAILTGRYPLAVDYDYAVRGWPGLSLKNTTIAEILRARGRTTGAITNYWYFDPQRHMNQGFDHYDNANKKLHTAIPGKGPAETRGSSSREQTDKAIAFAEKHTGEPFFLWVHYYDPHFGYERHAGFPTFGSRKVDRYDHEIRYTDHHIGRLYDALERLGIADRTAIVITGDHGEGFGEHGVDLHGYHLYGAQTRVPLIIRIPGIAPGRVTMPVGHIDILPTLANLAGAEPTAAMMGRSLLGVMTGGADRDADRLVFQQLSYENNNEMRAAAGKRCHIIYNVSPDTSWELYRIDIDPAETQDVIGNPGPCAGAREALEAWYDRSELPRGAAEALLTGRPVLKDPIHVAFGSEVVLLEVDLPKNPVARGATFDVTYTFAAKGTLEGSWKVFAHFESRTGGRFLGDHAPPRPFSWWKDGQFIRYTRTYTVPRHVPPGTYALWMGLFRKNERRPATSAKTTIRDNRALVGQVTVR